MGQIVVGVDGSDEAAEALRWAVAEAERSEATLTAVLAWGWRDQHRPADREGFDLGYGWSEAKAALDEMVEAAVGVDVGADSGRRAVSDSPARALLQVADGAELLVVGARGAGGFRGLLMGSVSQRCLRHATVPIAVVRRSAAAGGGASVDSIVVGTDGSANATSALRWAAAEARRWERPLTVVHSWGVPGTAYGVGSADPDLRPLQEEGRRLLNSAVADLASDAPPSVDRRLVNAVPTLALLSTAGPSDLIVVGSRGHGAFGRLLLGSVSQQVADHAEGSVVVVP